MRNFYLALIISMSACVPVDTGEPDPGGDVSMAKDSLSTSGIPSIAAGRMHSCSLLGDGHVECWGDGRYGQLGGGSFANAAQPAQVQGLADAVAVTTGWYHSCALRSDATVACWGYNVHGQLGDGTNTSRSAPVAVSGLTDVVSVSAGGFHTCAVTSSGGARCWGYNGYGGLGNGTRTRANTPQVVGGRIRIFDSTLFIPEQSVASVEAGQFHTCARKSSGSVRCWGRNQSGQLGDGTTNDSGNPVTVANLTGAVDVAAAQDHSCAVTASGNLWCWGHNGYGQLGDGSKTTQTSPVRGLWAKSYGIEFPVWGALSVTAGGRHTCVTNDSDVMWCAGDNQFGQQGTDLANAYFVRTTPVDAIEASAGVFHTCVRTPAGNVRCVGRDNWGQLGGLTGCSDELTAQLVSVVAPYGAELGKLNINYVEGNAVDVTVVTGECAQLDSVELAGLTLGTSPNPDGGTRYYEVLERRYPGDGTVELRIRVHFFNGENGTSLPLEVHLSSEAAASPVSVETMVVGVQSITTGSNSNGGVRMMVSENELYNGLVAGAWELFGDGNHYDSGSYPDFYGFDYAGMKLDVTPAGIYFQASAKAGITGDVDVCDPTTTVYGTFQIVADPVAVGLTTQWVDGPHTHTTFPLLCPGSGFEGSIFASAVTGWLANGKLRDGIDSAIGGLRDDCAGFSCDTVLNAIDHQDGAIEVELVPLFDTVSIRVPYDHRGTAAFAGVGDPMAKGMAFPPSEHLSFAVTGLAEVCSIPTADCTDDTRMVSGAGVFNRVVNPPFGTPWPTCDSPPCPVYAGRVVPWRTLRGARRDPASALPRPEANVGAVVGRTRSMVNGQLVESVVFDAGQPLCAMGELDSSDNRLLLGRNDIPAGADGWLSEYGTGEAIVTIGFPDVLGEGFAPCAPLLPPGDDAANP